MTKEQIMSLPCMKYEEDEIKPKGNSSTDIRLAEILESQQSGRNQLREMLEEEMESLL